MAKTLGQPIIIENKPGAGGNSGTAQAAKAAPDGYTLVGAGSGPMAANLTLYKDLGYDPQKDFTMISPFVSFTVVVTASNKLGVNSVQELIERAKKEPGALNYGSVGIGSSQHLAGEYFAQVTGVKTHARALSQHRAIRPGHDRRHGAAGLCLVSECSGSPDTPMALRRWRSRAMIGWQCCRTRRPRRRPISPQYKVDGWFGLAAPAGVPKDILERLNKELNAALNDPAVRGNFESRRGAVRPRPRQGRRRSSPTRSRNIATSSPRPGSRRSNSGLRNRRAALRGCLLDHSVSWRASRTWPLTAICSRPHLPIEVEMAMIQQLRIYEIFENNKAAFHARFRDHAARIMRTRYGFHIVAMWEYKFRRQNRIHLPAGMAG